MAHPQYGQMLKSGKMPYQHKLERPDSFLEEVIILLNEEI